jgi:hypothetical protein
MTLASWNPDIPFALLMIVLCVAMFLPEMIEGAHKYRRGRSLARQITEEQRAREFLDQQWKEGHGGEPL